MSDSLAAIDQSMFDATENQMGQRPQAPGRSGNFAQFYMHPVLDTQESNKQGRPIYREEPYVEIRVPGDKDNIVRRPVRTGMTPKHDNNLYHNEYVAFTQGQDAPVMGTLLKEWPQITRAQAMELNAINVRTVEELAEMPDGHASQYMGMGELKNRAANWLEMTKADQPLSEMRSEIEEQHKLLGALQETIIALQEELEAERKPKSRKKKDEE